MTLRYILAYLSLWLHMSKSFAVIRCACVFDMHAQKISCAIVTCYFCAVPNRMEHKQLFYHFLYHHGRIFDQIDDQLRVDRLTVLVLHNTQNRSFRKMRILPHDNPDFSPVRAHL